MLQKLIYDDLNKPKLIKYDYGLEFDNKLLKNLRQKMIF